MSDKDYIDLVHYGDEEDPPHETEWPGLVGFGERGVEKHERAVFMAKYHDVGMRDWAVKDRTAKFAHYYRARKSMLSPELFGDDYPEYVDDSIKHGPSQPQLFQTLPADPLDAIDNRRIVRLITGAEVPGSETFIAPKDAMIDGDIEYLGTHRFGSGKHPRHPSGTTYGD